MYLQIYHSRIAVKDKEWETSFEFRYNLMYLLRTDTSFQNTCLPPRMIDTMMLALSLGSIGYGTSV
jgi:hypothetical protein